MSASHSASLLVQKNSSLKVREMLGYLLGEWTTRQRRCTILWSPYNKFLRRVGLCVGVHTLQREIVPSMIGLDYVVPWEV